MLRNLLFTMSFAGSMVVMLYLAVDFFAKKYILLVWRYRILKMAVFFYLVPVAKWKYRVYEVWQIWFPELWNQIYREPKFHGAYSIVIEDKWMRWTPEVYRVVFLLMICGIVSVLIFSRAVFRDRRVRAVYQAGFEMPGAQDLYPLFSQVKKELRIRRKVKFQCSEHCRSPVTYGVLFPIICFPAYGEDRPDDRSLRYMLKHELLHIKHHDILVRYLGFLVLAVHWFNPFSYLLVRELSDLGEMYCDSGVLDGEGEDGRRKYGELLIQMAVRGIPDTGYSLFVGMAESRQKKRMKRRITEMKTVRKNQIILSMAVMICISMAGGMTAFAYAPPQTVGEAGNDSVKDHRLICDGAAFDGWFLDEDEKPEMVSWNDYFIDSSGQVTEVTEQQLLERAGCRHDYRVSGTYCHHVKNSQGGCTVTEYEAQKCSQCGVIRQGNVTNVITYQKCPH